MKHITSSLALLLVCAGLAAAGPLSRPGWGLLEWSGNAADAGRGGTGLAVDDSLRIGLRNPAGVSGGRLTRIQLGLGARSLTSRDTQSELRDAAGAFDQFYISFPLTWQRMSASMGLRPYSRMEFSLRNHDTNSEGEEYYEFLKGSGGLSLATVSLAQEWPDQHLKVGVETGLLFGSLRQQYSLFHVQSAPPFDVSNDYRLGAVGASVRLGALWQVSPGLSLGGTWTLPTRAKLSLDEESASNNTDRRRPLGRVTLPSRIEAGAAWHRGTLRWLADAGYSDWSATHLSGDLGEDERLGRLRGNTVSAALGVERLHEEDFTLAWFRKWDWRAGIRLEQGYMSLNSAPYLGGADEYHDVNLLALSTGCSIPTRDRRGWLDLGLEFTFSGDVDELGVEENGFRLRGSFAGSDLWFRRPVYNR